LRCRPSPGPGPRAWACAGTKKNILTRASERGAVAAAHVRPPAPGDTPEARGLPLVILFLTVGMLRFRLILIPFSSRSVTACVSQTDRHASRTTSCLCRCPHRHHIIIQLGVTRNSASVAVACVGVRGLPEPRRARCRAHLRYKNEPPPPPHHAPHALLLPSPCPTLPGLVSRPRLYLPISPATFERASTRASQALALPRLVDSSTSTYQQLKANTHTTPNPASPPLR